jgi:hypothetical protein
MLEKPHFLFSGVNRHARSCFQGTKCSTSLPAISFLSWFFCGKHVKVVRSNPNQREFSFSTGDGDRQKHVLTLIPWLDDCLQANYLHDLSPSTQLPNSYVEFLECLGHTSYIYIYRHTHTHTLSNKCLGPCLGKDTWSQSYSGLCLQNGNKNYCELLHSRVHL